MYRIIRNTLIVATVALAASQAHASEARLWTDPHSVIVDDTVTMKLDILFDYAAVEIERGFGIHGDIQQQRVGVKRMREYLDERRQDILGIGDGPQADPLSVLLEQRLADRERSLAAGE